MILSYSVASRIRGSGWLTMFAYSAFLPWHRYYLHTFETLLTDECGFTGGIPYWDEQRDFEVLINIDNASIWGSDNLSFGTNGENEAGCVIVGTNMPELTTRPHSLL